jgi:hypothetical protein
MDKYHMTDEAFASFAQKYPHVKRSDVEELFTQEIFAARAYQAQQSEIESLKSKALNAMGTDQEIRFSDIEAGMLRVSLAAGRQALKEILEKTPIKAPLCNDGTKMKDQGRKKKHNDSAGAC